MMKKHEKEKRDLTRHDHVCTPRPWFDSDIDGSLKVFSNSISIVTELPCNLDEKGWAVREEYNPDCDYRFYQDWMQYRFFVIISGETTIIYGHNTAWLITKHSISRLTTFLLFLKAILEQKKSSVEKLNVE